MTTLRPLNKIEQEILMRKNQRLGKDLEVSLIEYELLFPRTVLCTIITPGPESYMGVSMRAKNDVDIPTIGQTVAFTRALNQAMGVRGY